MPTPVPPRLTLPQPTSPRLTRRALRQLPCYGFGPPWTATDTPGWNDGDGQGLLYTQFDCFGRRDVTAGTLRVRSDLYHPPATQPGPNDQAWHRHGIMALRQAGPLYTGYHPVTAPGRVELELEFQAFWHDFRRDPVFPPPHRSQMSWRAEFHLFLPGGEVVKFPLAFRTLEGGLPFGRRAELAAPGTTKTFAARTTTALPYDQPLPLTFGLWSEHRVSASAMRLTSTCELTVKVRRLVICPAP